MHHVFGEIAPKSALNLYSITNFCNRHTYLIADCEKLSKCTAIGAVPIQVSSQNLTLVPPPVSIYNQILELEHPTSHPSGKVMPFLTYF
jgi:hypothetical protein